MKNISFTTYQRWENEVEIILIKINQYYDSDIDGKESPIFRDKILYHQQLYFIVVDSNDNVFGSYNSANFNQTGSDLKNDNAFMFTLYSNGRCGIKKYKPKSSNQKICILNGSLFNSVIFCNNGLNDYFEVYSIGNSNNSYLNCGSDFEEEVTKELIGVDSKSQTSFTTKRLIVIEMK